MILTKLKQKAGLSEEPKPENVELHNTLEELFAKAESFGEVTVFQHGVREKDGQAHYQVNITFQTTPGSSLKATSREATYKERTLKEALSLAIENAELIIKTFKRGL